MSNHLISLTYTRDLKTPIRNSVMVLMADKASDDGSGIWASRQTMADELCCAKRTVIDTIQAFIDEGLVSVTGKRGCLNGYTNEYKIDPQAIKALPLVKCHADKRCAKVTGAPAAPVHGAHGTGAPAAPKPSLNPPIPSGAKAPSVSREKRVDHALPDDFEVPDEWLDWAMEKKGWTRREAEYEAERFVNHALQNDRKVKVWMRAWRNWCLNDLCKTVSAKEAATAYRREPIRMP